jgi:hypothetical protein
MRLYTQSECEEWLSTRNREKPTEATGLHKVRVPFPPDFSQLFFTARSMAQVLSHDMSVILWITEWRIWANSENLHLYYKLRQSYGDHRLLPEAPGHLFLKHEGEDLTSYLQIAMLNGWGGYVLAEADYLNAFVSHDEYIDFYASDDSGLSAIREMFPPTATAE